MLPKSLSAKRLQFALQISEPKAVTWKLEQTRENRSYYGTKLAKSEYIQPAFKLFLPFDHTEVSISAEDIDVARILDAEYMHSG